MKKPTVWAKPNKGVKDRAARDIELEEISKPTLESARAILERKAQVYEKLSKGKSGGLNDKQYDSLLVDVSIRNSAMFKTANMICSSIRSLSALMNLTVTMWMNL